MVASDGRDQQGWRCCLRVQAGCGVELAMTECIIPPPLAVRQFPMLGPGRGMSRLAPTGRPQGDTKGRKEEGKKLD